MRILILDYLLVKDSHKSRSPEILAMTEMNDNPELQMYSSAVLYVLSAVTPPEEYVEVVADSFINTIKAATVRYFLC